MHEKWYEWVSIHRDFIGIVTKTAQWMLNTVYCHWCIFCPQVVVNCNCMAVCWSSHLQHKLQLLWWKHIETNWRETTVCVCFFFFFRWLRTGSMWPWWWIVCSCGSSSSCVWWEPWAYFSNLSSRIPSLPFSSPAQTGLVYEEQQGVCTWGLLSPVMLTLWFNS